MQSRTRSGDCEWHGRPRVFQLLRRGFDRIPRNRDLDRALFDEGKTWNPHTGLYSRPKSLGDFTPRTKRRVVQAAVAAVVEPMETIEAGADTSFV